MSKKYKVREFAKEIDLVLTLEEFDDLCRLIWHYEGDILLYPLWNIGEKLKEIKNRLEAEIDEEELITWKEKKS